MHKKANKELPSFYNVVESTLSDDLDFGDDTEFIAIYPLNLSKILENYGIAGHEKSDYSNRIMESEIRIRNMYKEEAKPVLQEYHKELETFREKHNPEKKRLHEHSLKKIKKDYLERFPELKSEDFIFLGPGYDEFRDKHPDYIKYKDELDCLIEEALKERQLLVSKYRKKILPIIKKWKNHRIESMCEILPDNISKKIMENRIKIEEKIEISADEFNLVFSSF